ncbi:hypothetical protein A9Q89_01275 [Gammaproteobacteria bacterium 53_120_T64]|nr:hypothetical protein A9Q89_01275 [Gammaproteobacteria bacterium 53_120_T64]
MAAIPMLERRGLAIYSLSCALSLLLFFTYGAIEDTLNDDGINYIYAAHALSEGLPEEAKSYRPETFFYRQISLIASLSGLELYTSAQALSLFWQILLGAGFIAIVRCFDTSLPSQLIALAVFFSIASLNHLRPDIIRGFSFWALQLWAVWAGLNLIKYRAWRFALLWLSLSAIATLYRAEGMAYLLLIPAFALINASFSGGFSAKQGLKLAGLIVITTGLIYLVFGLERHDAAQGTPQLMPMQNVSVADKVQKELSALSLAADQFERLKDNIAAQMPSKWAQRSVNDLLIGGLMFHLLLAIINTTNTPLLALSLYGGNRRRPFLSDPRHKLLANYILVGVIVGLLSVYSKFFISPRYIMLTAILLAIPATLMLSKTYQGLATPLQGASRLWKYLVVALPVFTCLYPLSHQNHDKRYIQDAGHWVKNHLNDAQKIYFNDQKVAFYSADYTNNSFKTPYTNQHSLLRDGYQYAVLYERNAKGEHSPLRQSLGEQRLKTFQNNRGRSVSVYKLAASAP